MRATGERYVPNKMSRDSEIEHYHRYTAAGFLIKGLSVLDAACGTGFGSDILARSAAHVTGIDISSEAIEYAQGNYGVTMLYLGR